MHDRPCAALSNLCDVLTCGLKLQIKGKVNALTVDSCQRLGILFEDLVSSCELVNSTRVQVQVTGVVPIIAIDKCDGVQVRLHITVWQPI